MPSNSEPLTRVVTIANDLGLHARAAAKLAAVARLAGGAVWLAKGTERIDAKQVIDILALAAAKGDQVKISIETAADLEILDRIAGLFGDGFGE